MNKKRIYIISSIVVIILVAGGFIYQGNKGGSSPNDATNEFLLYLQEHKYNKAGNFLGTETRKLYDEARYERLRKKIFGNSNIPYADPESIVFTNGGKDAAGTISIFGSKGSYEGEVIVTLSKNLLGWKIDNISAN